MLTKIGLLATEVCAPGGIQSFMLRLTDVLDSLVRDGEVSRAFCISLNDRTSRLQQHAAIPVTLATLGANRSKWRLFRQSLHMAPGTDVLFVGHIALSPLAWALKRMRLIKRYIVILHGIEAWVPAGWWPRLALRHADRLVATTEFTANVCARANHLPPNLFSVIPLCADERPVEPAKGFRLNGTFKLLCVARQDASERYKGFEQMFQALAMLTDINDSIHLNLVGDGDDHMWLRECANRLDATNKVTFWGRLSDDTLAAAYEDCDVYVMPSKKEGFGIVFLEAMRHGKPCIGGRHGGTPEVIVDGESGFLVEHGNAHSLAQAIQTLVDSPELCARLGEYGRRLVKANFGRVKFDAKYRALIHKTISA